MSIPQPAQVQPAAHFPVSAPGDAPAVVMGAAGAVTTHAELEALSNQWAHLLRGLDLAPQDIVAVCLDNCLEFLCIAVAAMRSGLVFLPISSKLRPAEVAFIVGDSGAKALVSSPAIGETFASLPDHLPGVPLVAIDGDHPGYRAWRSLRESLPTGRIRDESPGSEMLYSSGTTGRPKGIRYHKTDGGSYGAVHAARAVFGQLGIGADDIYLCPAPLYHAAPCAWSLAILSCGGTVVVMEQFDPEQALALIERYGVTISQWVPTHFVRMLKLAPETRERFDLSTLRLAVHAAAPCPVPVKHAMIEWWGPILLEYFGSSEQTILTIINSAEWLKHPGSVGRCLRGTLHICDEAGTPLPVGRTGQIFAEGGTRFYYHNDAERTAQAHSPQGWSTVGDLGYLDDDGYLFLTDRKGFMIITGGVNVYPQEIENLLVTHPKIADAAVIGLPDADLGEAVTAVVQPVDMSDAGDAFAAELRTWLREHLSGVKVPKRILFRPDLPRLPTGKMVKHLLVKELSA